MEEKKEFGVTFGEFQKLCRDIGNTSGISAKSSIIRTYLKTYTGDKYILAHLLLPKVSPRIFHIKEKKMIKLWSSVIGSDLDEMTHDFETGSTAGDIAATVSKHFRLYYSSKQHKSLLTLFDVDAMLIELTESGRFAVQSGILKRFCQKATTSDVLAFVRQLDHDLQINLGSKGVLEAFHPQAYEGFKLHSDLSSIIKKIDELRIKHEEHIESEDKKKISLLELLGEVDLMIPIKPQLAKACKSYADAFKKCPSGLIYAEIKYDGERLMIFWNGDTFKFYSRSLKPVPSHKTQYISEYLPKSCPNGKSCILDCEILLVDVETGTPLPFGTLNKHKKKQFENVSVCLFVFDILYYNGKSLINLPLVKRRELLEHAFTEVPNKLMFSEKHELKTPEELETLMQDVIVKGLEGLVLKDSQMKYYPGARKWLKMKRDYLGSGEMADTADLIVIGASYGTSVQTGGKYSTFLMGCYDPRTKKYLTVCRAHNGLDDPTIEQLTKTLQMSRIGRDINKLPSWMLCDRTKCPDLVITDPKKSVVFEITGAEFSESSHHTSKISDDPGAKGISIRFPRVTRIRTDKTNETATTLEELRYLVESSKDGELVSKLQVLGKRKKKKIQKIAPKKISRPRCRYGEGCYRKRPSHFQEFSHPHIEVGNLYGSNDWGAIANANYEYQKDLKRKQAKDAEESKTSVLRLHPLKSEPSFSLDEIQTDFLTEPKDIVSILKTASDENLKESPFQRSIFVVESEDSDEYFDEEKTVDNAPPKITRTQSAIERAGLEELSSRMQEISRMNKLEAERLENKFQEQMRRLRLQQQRELVQLTDRCEKEREKAQYAYQLLVDSQQPMERTHSENNHLSELEKIADVWEAGKKRRGNPVNKNVASRGDKVRDNYK